jgi:hypothetical protein
MVGGMTWWTADQCVDDWSKRYGPITRATWLRYVRAGRAPAHHHYDSKTGERVWDADVVRTYERPGQGSRTDLQQQVRPR